MNICALGTSARRIWSAIETGARKPNVLRGLCPDQAAFEQAIGQLFLRGMVRFNGKTTARVLERKP
jgi:hypothetical protein